MLPRRKRWSAHHPPEPDGLATGIGGITSRSSIALHLSAVNGRKSGGQQRTLAVLPRAGSGPGMAEVGLLETAGGTGTVAPRHRISMALLRCSPFLCSATPSSCEQERRKDPSSNVLRNGHGNHSCLEFHKLKRTMRTVTSFIVRMAKFAPAPCTTSRTVTHNPKL